jgi:hypothetical protein
MVSSVDVPIRPLKRNVRETTLSLVHIREKYGEEVGLVRTSARLSLLEMKRTTKVWRRLCHEQSENQFQYVWSEHGRRDFQRDRWPQCCHTISWGVSEGKGQGRRARIGAK